VDRDRVDGALYLVDVLLGDLRAEFVVSADPVALHPGLTDEHALVLSDVLEAHEIGFGRVDGRGRADDLRARPLVVLQEFVDDFFPRLSESDHCKFHRVLPPRLK